MAMICNRAKRCEEESCPYRVPHELNDDCEIVCVEGGRCVLLEGSDHRYLCPDCWDELKKEAG